eukprot:scaffold14246_cov105-Isochrysis_galbana.AAC.10
MWAVSAIPAWAGGCAVPAGWRSPKRAVEGSRMPPERHAEQGTTGAAARLRPPPPPYRHKPQHRLPVTRQSRSFRIRGSARPRLPALHTGPQPSQRSPRVVPSGRRAEAQSARRGRPCADLLDLARGGPLSSAQLQSRGAELRSRDAELRPSRR